MNNEVTVICGFLHLRPATCPAHGLKERNLNELSIFYKAVICTVFTISDNFLSIIESFLKNNLMSHIS